MYVTAGRGVPDDRRPPLRAVFGEDCVVQCAENSNLHGVRVNVTRMGREWRAVRCVECAHAVWPADVAGARLPRVAFEMNTSCVPTCLSNAGFFASSDPSTCLFCPHDACPRGTFWSALDNCTQCAPCARRFVGSEFTRADAFNDPDSCGEQCPGRSFQADDKTCRPYSAVACRSGLEYVIAGTPTSDAHCGTCADCSDARETVACTSTSNRECASCGPLDSWSGSWSKTGCVLVCRTSDGYTKLHTAQGEVCRKCMPCELGHERPVAPATCACQPCSAPLPSLAMYTTGCAWTWPAYHVVRTDATGLLACEYGEYGCCASEDIRASTPSSSDHHARTSYHSRNANGSSVQVRRQVASRRAGAATRQGCAAEHARQIDFLRQELLERVHEVVVEADGDRREAQWGVAVVHVEHDRGQREGGRERRQGKPDVGADRVDAEIVGRDDDGHERDVRAPLRARLHVLVVAADEVSELVGGRGEDVEDGVGGQVHGRERAVGREHRDGDDRVV